MRHDGLGARRRARTRYRLLLAALLLLCGVGALVPQVAAAEESPELALVYYPARVPAHSESIVLIGGHHLAGATEVLFGSTPGTIVDEFHFEGAEIEDVIEVSTPPLPGGSYEVSVVTPAGTSAPSERDDLVAEEPPELGLCRGGNVVSKEFSDKGCRTGGGGPYEWFPGLLAFNSTEQAVISAASFSGAAVALDTAAGNSVSCSGLTGSGVLEGPKEIEALAITLTGCSTTSGSCSSTGAGAGEVQSANLVADLVFTSVATKKVAWDLKPASGEKLFEMECGASAVVLRGSALLPVKVGKKPGANFSLKPKVKKGTQSPAEYEAVGGVKTKDLPEASFGGKPFEPAGLNGPIHLRFGPAETETEDLLLINPVV